MDAVWTQTREEVLQHFSVIEKIGLSQAQAAQHALLYGRNGMYLLSLLRISRHSTTFQSSLKSPQRLYGNSS